MSGSRLITVNGHLFNGPLVDGVEFEIEEVTGMGDPSAVANSEQRVAAHGATSTKAYEGPRAVGLAGKIRASDEVRAELAADVVRRLITLTEFPLTLHYASGDRTVWVRRDADVQFPSREMPTEFEWTATLRADDPKIYAGDPSGSANVVLSTGLPHQSGGLQYPVTYPITYSGDSGSGDTSAVLIDGGHLGLRIAGRAVNPSVTVVNSEGSFTLSWLGILQSGMWIDVDPDSQSAMLQGQSTRSPNVRQWPVLAPGLNEFRFRADEYESSAALTITIRPTL